MLWLHTLHCSLSWLNRLLILAKFDIGDKFKFCFFFFFLLSQVSFKDSILSCLHLFSVRSTACAGHFYFRIQSLLLGTSVSAASCLSSCTKSLRTKVHFRLSFYQHFHLLLLRSRKKPTGLMRWLWLLWRTLCAVWSRSALTLRRIISTLRKR